MKVESDSYAIDFQDAISAFKFDEIDKSKSTYHGLPMKAVDIIAELRDAYIFVEIKEYDKPDEYDELPEADDTDIKKRRDHFKWLKNYLKYKFRDSYLFRHAEQKVDKPIHYICILNLVMKKSLHAELPVGEASRRWKQKIVESCQVLDLSAWNRSFPKWPAQKMSKS